MAPSSSASGTAVSATSTPDIGLPSALSGLAVQDSSIPTPGKCHIDRCAIEILIQVAEDLDSRNLCALSRVSKRFSEAAQDVLYRFADLRPVSGDWEEYEYRSCLKKSGLAEFLWTITQKPHLATKVRELWFLPRSAPVTYPQLESSGVSLVSAGTGSDNGVAQVEETTLACDLLPRLTELRSLTITALDSETCRAEYYTSWEGGLLNGEVVVETVFERLPIRLEKLINLPCFSKLSSMYLSHGHLDWAIVTLPTLHTLCIGSDTTVQLLSDCANAPNITSLIFEADNNAEDVEFLRATRLLKYLPNVHALTLGSRLQQGSHSRFPDLWDDYFRDNVLGVLGFFSLNAVQAFLANGRSIEKLKFTYGENASFCDDTTDYLCVAQFDQLRRIETAECALIVSPAGCSGPADLLPLHIRTLVITHPTSSEQEEEDGKSKLTCWLGEMTRTDFPDLERVEIVCSVGFGDDVGFQRRFEDSAEIQRLKAIGVIVVVRKD